MVWIPMRRGFWGAYAVGGHCDLRSLQLEMEDSEEGSVRSSGQR